MSLLRRWGVWVVVAAGLVVVLAVGVPRSGHPTLDQRTLQIAAQVRCPVCEGQSAAQSDAPPSIQIRDLIHSELAAGRSTGQILDGLVASYGPGILEKPQTKGVDLLVWVLPLVAVVAAVAGLGLAFRRWRPRGTPAVDVADRELVGAALDTAAEDRR